MKSKKDQKEKSVVQKKQGKSFKEIVPLSSKPPREIHQTKPPENFNRDFVPQKLPQYLFPEWPNEDEINNFDFGLNSEFKFTDEFKIQLPKSMIEEASNEINWLRPEYYIKERMIFDKLKKNFPGKNYIKLRNQIKSYVTKPRTQSSLKIINEEISDRESIIEKNEDELMEDAKMQSYKAYIQIYNTNFEIKVVESFEREETEEEFKKRSEEFEAREKARLELIKKDKKIKNSDKKKFDDNKETLIPIKITVPRPSNVNMLEKYCDYSKWVASQLQVIKDLNIQDCNNSQLVFQKIYPQKGGVPVYNPSGRYWVKLKFMGKYRKVEIDDRIPCGKYDEPLTPSCHTLNELWPSLITKALLKINSYKYLTNNPDLFNEIGDCSVIHSLTGYIPELLSNETDYLKLLQNVLSDDFFSAKQKFLLCFTPQNEISINRSDRDENSSVSKSQKLTDPLGLSKFIKTKGSHKQISPFSVSPISQLKSSLGNVELKKNSLILNPNSTSASLGKPVQRSFTRTKTMVLSTNLKNDLTRNLKKGESKVTNFGLKSTNSSQKLKTNNDEGQEIKVNHTYKNILTNFAYSVIDYFFNDHFNMSRIKQIDFSDLKEEYERKKNSYNYKLLSKEERKKMSHEMKTFREKQREEKNRRIDELKKTGRKISLLKIKSEASYIPDLSFILPYNEDEIEMAKKCVYNKWEFPPPSFFEINDRNHTSMNRSDTEFIEDFNRKPTRKNSNDTVQKINNKIYRQLVGNVEVFSNEKNPPKRQSGYWIDYEGFLMLFKRFVILHNPKFYRTVKFIDNIWYNPNHDDFEINPDFQVLHLTPFLNLNEVTPALKLSNNKFNREESCLLLVFEPCIDNKYEFKDMNIYLLVDVIENDGTVLIKDLCLNSFFFTYQIDVLKSYSEYFLVFKSIICPLGFHLTIYSDHSIENFSYFSYLNSYKGFTLYPFKIEYPYLEKNYFNVIVRYQVEVKENSKFSFSLKNHDKNLKKYATMTLIQNEKSVILAEKEFIDLNRGESQFLLLSVNSPYNTPEGFFEIEFISTSQNIVFENIQHIDTFEVTDKYVPNKHGIIFQELIYSPELVFSTIFVKLRKVKSNQVPNPDPKRKGEFLTTHEYFDIEEKIRINLRLFKNGEILYSSNNFYNFLIQNIIFKGVTFQLPDPKAKSSIILNNHTQNTPYILVCQLELSESPSWILKAETSSDLNWVIRVTSSDTLCFVKDTSKEDSEKSLKESWEIMEAGRAEKARKARKKYQLEVKLKTGSLLTEEEDKILKEPRERKKTNVNPIIEEQKKNDNKPKQVKKEDKKKNVEPLPPINEKNILNLDKRLPLTESHSSIYIKDFLKYCFQARTFVIERPPERKINLTADLKGEITDRINTENEEMIKFRNTQIELFNAKKSLFGDSLKDVMNKNYQRRKEITADKFHVIGSRDHVKTKQNSCRETEKKLMDITYEIYDLNTSLVIFKEIINSGFKSEWIEKALKVISHRKEEIYKNELKKATLKDKQIGLKILEEIKLYGFKINNDVLQKLNEITI